MGWTLKFSLDQLWMTLLHGLNEGQPDRPSNARAVEAIRHSECGLVHRHSYPHTDYKSARREADHPAISDLPGAGLHRNTGVPEIAPRKASRRATRLHH